MASSTTDVADGDYDSAHQSSSSSRTVSLQVSAAARASIAASFARSSSLNTGTPTRTLHLTTFEQQQQQSCSSRDNTPLSMHELRNRPRSNPRNRTPMRYESPLNDDAFRSLDDHDHGNSNNITPNGSDTAPPHITLRPLTAGRHVGTMVPTATHTIPEQQQRRQTNNTRSCHHRSHKQGPSHRKVRRWQNDKCAGLAAAIHAQGGVRAADVLTKAAADAHLYRAVYDPLEHSQRLSRTNQEVQKFLHDADHRPARDAFFEGHGPTPQLSHHAHRNHHHQHRRTSPGAPLTGQQRWHRVHPRLRRLVQRASHNSYAAAKVVGVWETYLLKQQQPQPSDRDGSRSGGGTVLEKDWWNDLLLECPTVENPSRNSRSGEEKDLETETNHEEQVTTRFLFNPTSSAGGFHRLLLQAVAQYHGLHAVPSMVAYPDEKGERSSDAAVGKARALTVRGTIVYDEESVGLLEHLGESDESAPTVASDVITSVCEGMSSKVRV